LGKYEIGKACPYVNRLQDIDFEILKQLIGQSVEHLRESNQ
jgi:hypothetical protein